MQVTALTKFKHSDLWAAAKRLGSQSALARAVGTDPGTLGRWIHFQAVPKEKFAEALLEVTGKTIEEMWPAELREQIELTKHSPRVLEQVLHVKELDLLFLDT